MPHIIVEYAESLFDEAELVPLLQSIHESVASSGLFVANQIKTRAYPFRAFTQGGEPAPYLHIQARIKAGRDNDNKKRLGEVILAGLKTRNIEASVVTVEIIDMDRGSYGKYIP